MQARLINHKKSNFLCYFNEDTPDDYDYDKIFVFKEKSSLLVTMECLHLYFKIPFTNIIASDSTIQQCFNGLEMCYDI